MNKLTDIVKRYGIKGCLYKMILRFGRLSGVTYIKYLAYFKSLPPAMDNNSLPQYQRMTMDNFRKQAKLDPQWLNNRKLNQIESFINEPGYSYYGIYEEDKLICYGGISMDYDNFIHRKTDSGAAYLFDDYTNPLYRGKGLHKKIIEIREYETWRQEKSITFAYVLSSNPASAKGFKRCRYVPRLKLIYKQIGKNKPLERKIIKL